MSSNEVEQTCNVNTLVDSYCAAWNERDGIKRLVMLAEVLTPDVRYVDPAVELSGREALATHIDVVFARYPGSGILRTTRIDRHHNRARFGWRKVLADGSLLADSVDFVEFARCGKICLIVGFFGPLIACE
ncbi:nuclear transport factor 2 family protein [Bradyrhizobium sp. 199]|uniref:nuclear transport factor 2 family protein n=1 Tax=Bradyrhizobium sp. 199 TaxID=2782664 RepID=UPI001FFA3F78|nr:nuclear transport factor 2 family protein [Bradyrhizobium sp. 199]MCK1357680.1 nuclear transport factor 2 family protein [Bradyrhizobium sp. 199]